MLTEQYKEAPIWRGLVGENLAELWSSSDGNSWTFIINAPIGRSCVLGSGEAGDLLKHQVEPNPLEVDYK